MSNTDPVNLADAQAELARAEADVAAAEAAEAQAPPASPEPTEPAPAATPDPAAPAGPTVRLSTVAPWTQFDPGDGLPIIPNDGTDVPATVAPQVLAAAERFGIALRED